MAITGLVISTERRSGSSSALDAQNKSNGGSGLEESRSRWIALALPSLAARFTTQLTFRQSVRRPSQASRLCSTSPRASRNLSVLTDCFGSPLAGSPQIPLYLAFVSGAFEDTLVAGCRIARGIGDASRPWLWQGVYSGWPQEPISIGPVIGAIAAGALFWEFDDASRDKSLTGQAKANAYLWGMLKKSCGHRRKSLR